MKDCYQDLLDMSMIDDCACVCVQSQRATDGMTMCHAAMNFPILFENGEPTTLQAQHAVEGRNHHPQTAPRYWEIQF